MIQDILSLEKTDDIFSKIHSLYAVDENIYVKEVLSYLSINDTQKEYKEVTDLVSDVRKEAGHGSSIDSFLQEYSLDTKEGITLMCLAETLLRIPDSRTIDSLIEDRITSANWKKHLSKSDSLFVNASTWGLMLTGKVTSLGDSYKKESSNIIGKMVDRLGEPLIRTAMRKAMKIMGKQFVLGKNIDEALSYADKNRSKGYTHSFDMLGEAALTRADAKRYYDSYYNAITKIGEKNYNDGIDLPSISIKLSALHPRYEEPQKDSVLNDLYNSLLSLTEHAKKLNVPVTIDAEETDRLLLSLQLFKKLISHPNLKEWGMLGLAIQTYNKQSLAVSHWINTLAKELNTKIPVRIVKGAYWDSEIKHSQQLGLKEYPLFTRKENTDLSYEACTKYILENTKDYIFPQFATHNAQTIINVLNLSKKTGHNDFEFQRLHGMGDALYKVVLDKFSARCRIYAPVGAHKDLLPYLVRRLLENGANTSFVHKLVDPKTPIDSLAKHPFETIKNLDTYRNEKIKKPLDIFKNRKNSEGENLYVNHDLFLKRLEPFINKEYDCKSLINVENKTGDFLDVFSPQNKENKVGRVQFVSADLVDDIMKSANSAYKGWANYSTNQRAEILHKIADLYEENKYELISLCINEAGKTLQDGIDEIREAVDFCRYYAEEAKKNWGNKIVLDGPTGEENTLCISGRGTFICISPWNFPLAIFTGQIVAALVTGNTVVAKPAESTNLIAIKAGELMHKAGIPEEVLQIACGVGGDIGQKLIEHPLTRGVCFTGSTAVSKRINITLAEKNGPITPLICETGGQNAMIVDSSALAEQVVNDVLSSSFRSAGQRCSALRVLFVQKDISEHLLSILKGAIDELVIGDPAKFKTDVGPVINKEAKKRLDDHLEEFSDKIIMKANAPNLPSDNYVLPTVIKLDNLLELKEENFGPILHIRVFAAKEIDGIIDEINSTGYGLTFGVHSRNESFAKKLANEINAGNIYINRNQIGAVVGVNPFGGHGLSGTGPKAGGPHYLMRFINEKTISNNITAIGGNATLLTLGDAT